MRSSDWSSDVCSSDLDAGLPAHPARMPIALASKMIEFLSRPGEIVFDPFAGSGTTARAAENPGRHWITTEAAREYVEGSKIRFSRSEERRVGNECVGTCRSRWSTYHSKKNTPN